MESLRFEIRVKPGVKGERVGGTWGDTDALVVAVTEPARDGRANQAALELVARVLGVRARQLTIVSGHKARIKLIELSDPPDGVRARLEEWKKRA